jgi:hypothetical protein
MWDQNLLLFGSIVITYSIISLSISRPLIKCHAVVVIFLLGILEITDSILGSETEYSEVIRGFLFTDVMRGFLNY